MFKKIKGIFLGVFASVAAAANAFAVDTSVTDMFAAADVTGLASSQKALLVGFIAMAVGTTAYAIVVTSVKKARGAAR